GVSTLLGGRLSSHLLPPHWPGTINPLLWPISTNTQDVSPSLLNVGMEHTQAFLLRAAIQRTYGVTGTTCPQNVIDPASTALFITPLGYQFALAWVIPQLLINAIALIAFIPWLTSKTCIMPAYRLCKNSAIFTSMAAKSRVLSARMKNLSSNLEDAYMWPRMDVTLRLGESIDTVEDVDEGLIVFDQPKLVGPMVLGKNYE
ncbi:hypothetical protein HDU91_003480, partial [Kappamyces sp. JEL0680]